MRQCEKYYLDLLNIDQSGNKTGKGKGNQKTKSLLASDPIHIVGDVEYWKINEEDVSVSTCFTCLILLVLAMIIVI